VLEPRRRVWMTALCLLLPNALALAAEPAGWAEAETIRARIQAPRFPERTFDVRDYGAAPDGRTDATRAFRRAIDAASAAGGGRVLVPVGVFVTGAIRLRSNVDLHVSEGATIRFSQDPAAYLPVVLTRYEGVECWNYSPLIYAYGEKNVAVTGSGVLEGGADDAHWWPWKALTRSEPGKKSDRDALFDAADRDVPVQQRPLPQA
jgi:polygalacturonase